MTLIGSIDAKRYRINVAVDSPPRSLMTEETEYLYITKFHADGSIDRRSIGLGMSELSLLIYLLQEANSQYSGQRKEYSATRKGR